MNERFDRIQVDGLIFDFRCRIVRTHEVRPSEISGQMMDKSWLNDVIGTYLKYDFTLEYPAWQQDDYDRFVEVLSDPVDAHEFLLPYGQGQLRITAKVYSISDEYKRLSRGRSWWTGTRFSIVTVHPVKEMGLEGVLARGRAPLPDIAAVAYGDVYTYTPSGWVKTVYTDADAVYY